MATFPKRAGWQPFGQEAGDWVSAHATIKDVLQREPVGIHKSPDAPVRGPCCIVCDSMNKADFHCKNQQETLADINPQVITCLESQA